MNIIKLYSSTINWIRAQYQKINQQKKAIVLKIDTWPVILDIGVLRIKMIVGYKYLGSYFEIVLLKIRYFTYFLDNGGGPFKQRSTLFKDKFRILCFINAWCEYLHPLLFENITNKKYYVIWFYQDNLFRFVYLYQNVHISLKSCTCGIMIIMS